MNQPERARDQADFDEAFHEVRARVAAFHYAHRARLPHWVLFGPNTSDYPGLYVARMWWTVPDQRVTDLLVRAGSLEVLRSLMPDVACCFPRMPGEDANILEVWM